MLLSFYNVRSVLIMILIVSDLHLGSEGADSLQFETFLIELLSCKETQQGRFADATALIMLGDIFDLLRDRLGRIDQKYHDTIFRRLERLNKRPDFHVFFALGNHDIYLQKYDREGQRTETEFIDPVGFPFYEEQFYVALLRNVNGNWYLYLYDEKKAGFFGRLKRFVLRLFRIKRKNELKFDKMVSLGPSSADPNYFCILCHGHQYEFLEELEEEAGILLTNLAPSEHKILRGLMDLMERPLVKIRKFLKRHDHNWISVGREKIYMAFSNAPFYPQIDAITDVIYGHTHIVDPKPTTPPQPVIDTVDGLKVANSGCWLMTKPTFIIIHDNGDMTTHYYGP